MFLLAEIVVLHLGFGLFLSRVDLQWEKLQATQKFGIRRHIDQCYQWLFVGLACKYRWFCFQTYEISNTMRIDIRLLDLFSNIFYIRQKVQIYWIGGRGLFCVVPIQLARRQLSRTRPDNGSAHRYSLFATDFRNDLRGTIYKLSWKPNYFEFISFWEQDFFTHCKWRFSEALVVSACVCVYARAREENKQQNRGNQDARRENGEKLDESESNRHHKALPVHSDVALQSCSAGLLVLIWQVFVFRYLFTSR
jgi:hypothetical protein